MVSQALKEEAQKLLLAKGAGESVLMDEGDGALATLFGIDLRATGENRIPTEPGLQVRIPATTIRKKSGKSAAKEAKKTPPQRNKQEHQDEIQDALQALKIRSGDIFRLESELKSLFK